jgi:hypothetical protein
MRGRGGEEERRLGGYLGFDTRHHRRSSNKVLANHVLRLGRTPATSAWHLGLLCMDPARMPFLMA